MLLVFLLKYKLHPEPSSFNFFFSYGMAVKKNIINTVDTRMFNMGDTKYEPGEIKSYAAHFFLIGNTINFERDLRNAHQGLLMIRGVDDFEFSQNTVKAISNRGPLYDFAYCRGTIKNNQIKGNFKPVKSGASVHIWQ